MSHGHGTRSKSSWGQWLLEDSLTVALLVTSQQPQGFGIHSCHRSWHGGLPTVPTTFLHFPETATIAQIFKHPRLDT